MTYPRSYKYRLWARFSMCTLVCYCLILRFSYCIVQRIMSCFKKCKRRLETPSSLSAFCFYWTELGINNFSYFVHDGKEKKIDRGTSFTILCESENEYRDFPGGAVVKNLPANSGDMGWSPGLGRSHMPRSS